MLGFGKESGGGRKHGGMEAIERNKDGVGTRPGSWVEGAESITLGERYRIFSNKR